MALGFHGRMAVAAVDPVVADMVLVAEWDRLGKRLADRLVSRFAPDGHRNQGWQREEQCPHDELDQQLEAPAKGLSTAVGLHVRARMELVCDSQASLDARLAPGVETCCGSL